MFSGIFAKVALGLGIASLITIGTLAVLLRLSNADRDTAVAKQALIQAALDQQVQVNRDNLVELAEAKAHYAAGMVAVSAERDAAAVRGKILNAKLWKVIHAPTTDDAPCCAPVLSDVLNGLQPGAATGATGADPARAGAGAGGAGVSP